MANFYVFYPPSGGGSSSNASVGTNGIAAPTSSTEVGGINPSGNLQPLQTDASGNLLVSLAAEPGAPLHVIVDSSALPTGASTSALQGTGNTSLASIDTKTPALGQAVSASSSPVVIASNQSAIPVMGSGVITTGTVSSAIDVFAATDVSAYGSISLQLIITGTATVTFQGSNDGVNFRAVAMVPTSGSGAASTVASSSSISVSPVEYKFFKPTVTSYSNGSITGTMMSSQGSMSDPGLRSTTVTNQVQVVGTGTAGSPAGGVLSVQGVASGTAIPVSIASVPIATGAATSALQSSTQGTVAAGTAATASTLVGAVFNSTTPAPTNGQGVAIQVDQFSNQLMVLPDQLLIGQSTQTATVNNILTAASGTAASNLANYRSASVQVVSTGTAGAYIFEGSNDNVSWITIPVYNQLIITGTPIIAAVTASASQIIYTFPITTQFVRLRISTLITGGSIQAFSRFSQAAFAPAITQVAQGTAANLATTSTIASGTVTTVSTVTSANSAIPTIVADVTSAAIITTTTTATLTPTFGSSYQVNIPVTVVSGSTPTMSVAVQESADTGTNWYTVYTFPTIIATGSYNSPVLTLTGNRIRYVQTIGGSTPSFTRAINRLQSSQAGYTVPTGTIYTDRSGTTSGTPSTSTQVAAANQVRRYFIIQNLSSTAPIYINFTAAAATTGSIYLAPFASYTMEASTITTEAINVLSATASVNFVAKEG